MAIFSWITLGFAALLLLGSGIAWGLFLAMDDSAWRKLGIKVFRIAMVVLLFYVNAMVYVHIVRVFRGEPPVVSVELPSSD
jgi:hypothetical protein